MFDRGKKCNKNDEMYDVWRRMVEKRGRRPDGDVITYGE